MASFKKKFEKWLDIGCSDAYHFFGFCFQNPDNEYFLVDIDDHYFTRMDNPNRVYNKLKSILFLKVISSYPDFSEIFLKVAGPHRYYPKTKSYMEIISENLDDIYKFAKKIPIIEKNLEYEVAYLLEREFANDELKIFTILLKESGCLNAPLIDFLYSEMSPRFEKFVSKYCRQMKFFHADATEKLNFADKTFDRVYVCGVGPNIGKTKELYAQSRRLSKEGTSRMEYIA